MRVRFLLFSVPILVAFSACSFSKSSESISDSISSPSKSSSESSTGKSESESGEPEKPQDAAAYEADVAQVAGTYARNGGDIGALRSAVTNLATERGITNWETDPDTCQAIGRGVAEGGMGNEAFQKFSKDLFGDDLTKASELRKGYQSVTVGAAPTHGGS
jgi:hypothetical protein